MSSELYKLTLSEIQQINPSMNDGDLSNLEKYTNKKGTYYILKSFELYKLIYDYSTNMENNIKFINKFYVHNKFNNNDLVDYNKYKRLENFKQNPTNDPDYSKFPYAQKTSEINADELNELNTTIEKLKETENESKKTALQILEYLEKIKKDNSLSGGKNPHVFDFLKHF
jgi:hypothetical protein